jgi:hypothetical protein
VSITSGPPITTPVVTATPTFIAASGSTPLAIGITPAASITGVTAGTTSATWRPEPIAGMLAVIAAPGSCTVSAPPALTTVASTTAAGITATTGAATAT